MATASSFIGTGGQGTPGVLGQTAVNNMKAAGYSDAQIKSMAAAEGLSFGSSAASSLGGSVPVYVAPSPSPSPSPAASSASSGSGFNPYDYNNGGTGFGQAAVDRAKADGWTEAQIAENLFRSGLNVGDTARATLTFNPTEYMGTGSTGGFGANAYEQAKKDGWSDSQIRSGLATHNTSTSDKVLSSFEQSIDDGSGRGYDWSQHTLSDGDLVFSSGPMNVDFATWTSPAKANIASGMTPAQANAKANPGVYESSFNTFTPSSDFTPAKPADIPDFTPSTTEDTSELFDDKEYEPWDFRYGVDPNGKKFENVVNSTTATPNTSPQLFNTILNTV